MTLTTIGLLHIESCVPTNYPTLLISVFSIQENITKHYLNVNATDKSTTENQLSNIGCTQTTTENR